MAEDELVAEDPNGYRVLRHEEPDWIRVTGYDVTVYELIKPDFGKVGRIEVISAKSTEDPKSIRAIAPRILDQMNINPDIRGTGAGKWFMINVVNKELETGRVRTSFFRTPEAERLWDAIVRDNPQIQLVEAFGEGEWALVDPADNILVSKSQLTHVIGEPLHFVPTERHKLKFMAFKKRIQQGRGWWKERERHSNAARRGHARR